MRPSPPLSVKRLLGAVALAFTLPGLLTVVFLFLNVRTPLSLAPLLEGTDLLGLLVLVVVSGLAAYAVTFFLVMQILGSLRATSFLVSTAFFISWQVGSRRHAEWSNEAGSLAGQMQEKIEAGLGKVTLGKAAWACSPGRLQLPLTVERAGLYHVGARFDSHFLKQELELAAGAHTIEMPFAAPKTAKVEWQVSRAISNDELFGRDLTEASRKFLGETPAPAGRKTYRFLGRTENAVELLNDCP